MIIAGEASGDLHGAKVVQSMRDRCAADLFFFGIGGKALKEAGVRICVDASTIAVVGITEAFSKLYRLIKAVKMAKQLIAAFHPDLLILVDFPDFNLHVAAAAKKQGVPVLYYISPQVWAWRAGRVQKIGRLTDHIAVILPFEEAFYRKHGIPVTFVGHPLLDSDFSLFDQTNERQPENFPVIGLLPGSRDKEIARHLPIMLDTVRILKKRIDGASFLISLAPSLEKDYVEKLVRKYEPIEGVEFVSDRVENIFKKCLLVVAASGTVTLEAAICGTPIVIIYKMSALTYWLGKLLVRVKYIGLVNLIAEKMIVPELVQDRASPKEISDVVLSMINDSKKLKSLRSDISSVRDALGPPGAANRVADIAIRMLAM
ncbi:lipid-A-disaccharide synthase [Thermodesulfobacteriota bacterium]